MGYPAENVVNAALLAWEGAPREQVAAVADGARRGGFGGVHDTAVGALAVRDLADGHYRDAYHRLQPLIADPFLQVTPLQYPDYVEAAARAGRDDEARDTVTRLTRLADANDSPWCRGVAERCLALVTGGPDAEPHFRAALTTLGGTAAGMERGRTHLVYGEWLRRTKRRRDAKEQLYAALDAFDRSGAAIFAQRARAELLATGEHLAADERPDPHALTPREETIARLAATGQTNAEIAATLFVSPNTVDYHLRKVYQKLGVTSRPAGTAPPTSASPRSPPPTSARTSPRSTFRPSSSMAMTTRSCRSRWAGGVPPRSSRGRPARHRRRRTRCCTWAPSGSPSPDRCTTP